MEGIETVLYALIKFLIEKGLLTTEELNELKRQVAERLVKRFVDSGLDIMYQDPEFDKYTFDKETDVDCEGWTHAKPCVANCRSHYQDSTWKRE